MQETGKIPLQECQNFITLVKEAANGRLKTSVHLRKKEEMQKVLMST